MNKTLCIFLSLFLTFGIVGCGNTLEQTSSIEASPTTLVLQAGSAVVQSSAQSSMPIESIKENNMIGVNIQIGSDIFSATLTNSKATREFIQYLPMTVKMADLNGQEKYYDLTNDLPSDSSERPSTIYNGEIMCWSGNTLVVFYSTFQNSYGGYVRLGSVDEPDKLAAALGTGNAEVTWTLD